MKIKTKVKLFEEKIQELNAAVKEKVEQVNAKHQMIVKLEEELNKKVKDLQEKLELTEEAKLLQEGQWNQALTQNEDLRLTMSDIRNERAIDQEMKLK